MLSIRLLDCKILILSFDEDKRYVSFYSKNAKQPLIKIDRDIAYRIHKNIEKILKNISFISEEIHFDPFYIRI